MPNSQEFREGLRDGIPIALGYLAVGFTLGIVARNAGLSPVQGLIASFTNNASAGEYAGFTSIAAQAPLLELALVTLIANARYLLMSCSLSQKLAPDTSLMHRLAIGWDVTDEIFGISIARHGYLNPWYTYGAMALALPGWALGTFFGVVSGNILPVRVVGALSVALYGMFFAIIIPPARKDRAVCLLVAVSYVASFLASRLPVICDLSSGTRIIILTVLIAGVAAIVHPVTPGGKEDAS